MYNHDIEELKERFLEVIIKTENQEHDYEELIYDLTNDVEREIEFIENDLNNDPKYGLVPTQQLRYGPLFLQFKDLLKDINILKRDNNCFDAEGELDMMFPDRNDEDFDEDSTSFDSAFGDD